MIPPRSLLENLFWNKTDVLSDKILLSLMLVRINNNKL